MNLTEREGVLLAAGGRFLAEMRIVPFTSILESSLDKLRASLASARPELLGQLETLRFIGVPALAAAPEVLDALEAAWFERSTLRIRYAGSRETTERSVRLESIVLDRSLTLLNAYDLGKGEPRQFRLDRVEWAKVEGR